MQRLYVGGLSHSITEKDLKDRFGKFGDVQDVELRTRRDDEGVPYKTFSYININISDADLKKCLTVLNKSKWKGGTLQIEKAKESFLHRLAEERQTAAERSLQTPEVNDKRKKLLDSLSKAGVENFTMKAAVPGTEVPGHKDWVVSKFGRVLPILQLQCQKGSRARTLKYDPSKFSHNIRRLDRKDADVEQHTPIDQLTWELQGADSDISKKRRGEFPPYEPPKAKKRPTHMVHSNSAADRTRSEPTINQTETRPFTNGFDPSTNRDRRPARRWPPSNDSDVDSDEEIRRLVAAQDNSHNAVWQQEEEDHLEVVGLDYLVTPGRSHQQQKGRTDDEDENGYDSADTDELFASRKPPLPPAAASSEEKQSVVAAKKLSGTNIDRKMTKSKDVKEEEKPGNHGKQSSQKQDSSSEEDDDEDDEESESDDSCSDSDYDAMFSNITYLQISLADLQKVAEESQQDPETTTPSILGSKQETNIKVTSERPAPKKGITPEDILASIMGDDNSDDDKKKKKRKGATSAALPAFQGTKCLDAMSEMKKQEEEKKEEVEEGRRSAAKRQKLDSESLQTAENRNKKKEEETSGSSEEEEEDVASLKDETSSSLSSDDDEEDEDEVERIKTSSSQKVSSSASIEKDEDKKEIISAKVVSSTPSPSESSTSEEDEEEEEQEEQQPPPRVSLRPEEEEQRQKEANRRRLAAIQQRIKDAEEHKKLIQGALSKVDAPTTGAGKHIVFGSDDEEEEPTSEVTTQKKTLLQDSQSEEEDTGDEMSANEKVCGKTSGPRLFGGSDDDDDEDSNEDVSRFDIRPQFEGRAGQKLMELQSRFGTDERFRMDSRFLEDDKGEDEESERKKSLTEEDEDLEEERKKNLSILQTILGSGEQIGSNKTAGKAKTFRDVSALHYDPSKEEHAAFETKTEETKKESKAARRKKREEAEKLPEVSKEIYYDVSGDLKAVFGLTKDNVAERKEKASWDQEEEEEGGGKDEEPSLMSSLALADPNTEKQEPSGFTFSFFGDDTVTESKETAEYKVETIQAPKVSWQQDPRFQDSSSEEEDEDEEEQEKDEEQQSSTTTKTTEQERPSQIDLFFFFPDDSRLTEGPRLFCRSSQLEKQREQWEERRTALRQEYRKKHKDARRKLKSSLKS